MIFYIRNISKSQKNRDAIKKESVQKSILIKNSQILHSLICFEEYYKVKNYDSIKKMSEETIIPNTHNIDWLITNDLIATGTKFWAQTDIFTPGLIGPVWIRFYSISKISFLSLEEFIDELPPDKLDIIIFDLDNFMKGD